MTEILIILGLSYLYVHMFDKGSHQDEGIEEKICMLIVEPQAEDVVAVQDACQDTDFLTVVAV